VGFEGGGVERVAVGLTVVAAKVLVLGWGVQGGPGGEEGRGPGRRERGAEGRRGDVLVVAVAVVVVVVVVVVSAVIVGVVKGGELGLQGC
jgi:hypothetical protein